jgi:hypothetical protein
MDTNTTSTNEKPQNETVFVSPGDIAPASYSPEERHFIELLSQGVPVVDACNRALITRATVYRRRSADPAFASLWNDALQMAGDLLEEEADRRGRHGWEENVWHKGRVVGTRRHFSDRMLMFRLKALKPERYGKPG